MKSEFYICQMIRYNKEFRSHVARLIGIPNYAENDASYVLSVMMSDGELNDIAMRMNCSVDEVFSEIRRQSNVHHGLSSMGLKKDDLQFFRNQKFLDYLSSQLRCGNNWSEIVYELFDAQTMMDLSLACGILGKSEEVNLAQLFWRLTSNDGVKKIANQGIGDVWSAIDAMLEEKARDKLAKSLGCSGEQVLGHLFSSLRQELPVKEVKIAWNDGTEALDFFAIEFMRRRFWAISDSFLVQAKIAAEQLRTHVDSSHPASLLHKLIQFYGSRFYRKVLEQFIEPEQTVGSLCNELQILLNNSLDKPVNLKCDYETDENNQSFVTVKAIMPETMETIDVSKLFVADEETGQHLKKHIPYSSEDLSRNGESLAQRIQSTFIKRLPTLHVRAWDLMNRLKVNELVQFFVLSGRDLPDGYGLRKIFSSIHSTGKISINRSKAICKEPTEICKLVTENYDKDNKKYKLV